jgi:hypothetical protein
VHYCPATKQHTQREYRDSTSLDLGMSVDGRTQLPTPSVYPSKVSTAVNCLYLDTLVCRSLNIVLYYVLLCDCDSDVAL